METENYHDILFSKIKSQFGEHAARASGAALSAIFNPYRDLKPDVATAARYLRASIENKTEALHNIYSHLCERRKKDEAVPGCYETLLTQMVSRDKIGAGNIVVSVVDNRVSDAVRSDKGSDEGSDEGVRQGSQGESVFNSGAVDEDAYYGELLPVSINCLRKGADYAADILEIKHKKDFKCGLKWIPCAAVRIASTSAKIALVECYSSPRIVFLREMRLKAIHAAAARGCHEATRALEVLSERSEIDTALIALVLPAVYNVGTLVRLVHLDTTALARALRSVRRAAKRVLREICVQDADAFDALVAGAISAAGAGQEPNRQSPRQRKPGPETR